MNAFGDSVASPTVWAVTTVVLVAVLALDIFVIARRPHEPTMAEVGRHLAVFIGLAVLFGIGLAIFAEPHALSHNPSAEFFAGWLTEYSLSVDNLFIFIIIMANFKVPREYQQTALMVGIVLALIMRGAFIFLGAAAINQFSWVFYLFGLFLVYTAVKLAREGGEDEDEYEENRLVRFAEKNLPATSDWHGTHLLAKVGGKRLMTPMFFVVLTLGTTDLLFALDSIPAIYGLTRDPYIVFTANLFALMGLRQLYFLIGGLLERLIYLSYGLAFLLGFIGVKLILHALHENELPFINGGHHVEWAPDIPIWLSLAVILGTLAITTVASLIGSRRMSEAERDAVTGPRRDWEHD
ncbi:TerC/Alx family metal homeostasis membrane protein [Nocardioides sp. CER19]|uniref:TerC/Alx family metal homeostasis membrane protein n=1 Tax=Nocardioides sp. CER19 TaxID=3038538 RepID=UPI00244B406A|nr:TerC/Alx family metal homeostasis membrane protein [Nocardioides sp. CER19]MDH2414907.1 TerC/Alx family metal homeostasis membrane protein [Nocardioides sp. CER19]